MRYALALLLLLVSSIATAQVYKCTHDGGHVAFQDTPCAARDQSVLLHVGADAIDDLLGCFSVTPHAFESGKSNDFTIQVRLIEDGYQLRAIGGWWGAYSSAFKLRRANRHELDTVSEASHLRLRAGLTVRWNPGTEPAPVGIYKGEDASGRTQYLMFFRNTYGPALRMACP